MPLPKRSDHSSTPTGSGAGVFASYRNGVDETSRTEDRRIGGLDLVLAIGGNLAAIGFCFAPWLRYQERLPGASSFVPDSDNGFATDGWIVLASAVIATIAFVVAAVQADQAFAATIGFAATVLAFLAAGATWMLIGMSAPAGADAVRAEWGVMAATGASVVACIFAFRVMQAARIY